MYLRWWLSHCVLHHTLAPRPDVGPGTGLLHADVPTLSRRPFTLRDKRSVGPDHRPSRDRSLLILNRVGTRATARTLK